MIINLTHPLLDLPIKSIIIWNNLQVEYWGIEYIFTNGEPIYRILVPSETRYRSVKYSEIKRG